MEFIFDAQIQIRTNALKAIVGLDEKQLNTIPEGFGNTILWNLGHMVATQQILCYKLSGAPLLVTEEFLSFYKKDSSPKLWPHSKEITEVIGLIEQTNSAFKKDYSKGLFANFIEYKTSSGIVLKNSEDSIIYNYGHENLHYGIILAMKKLV